MGTIIQDKTCTGSKSRQNSRGEDHAFMHYGLVRIMYSRWRIGILYSNMQELYNRNPKIDRELME